MTGVDFRKVFQHLALPVLVVEVALDQHQFGAANTAFFDQTGLSLADFHKGAHWMDALGRRKDGKAGVLSEAALAALGVFLESHVTEPLAQREKLDRSRVFEGICFVVYPYEGAAQHGEIKENILQGRELALFFNNSIFGAFFMAVDPPVAWNEEVDKEAAIAYLLDHLRLTRVNQAMLDQYGARREDFIGRTPRDFFEHDLEQEKRLLRDIFLKGKHRAVSFERNQQGEEVIFEGDYVVLRHDNGDIVGLFGLQQDITARHQYIARIEDQNHKLREIAWFQSHVVRAPLARLLSLIHLLADESATTGSERLTLINHLRDTAREMDDVITQTVRRTKGIDLSKSALE